MQVEGWLEEEAWQGLGTSYKSSLDPRKGLEGTTRAHNGSPCSRVYPAASLQPCSPRAASSSMPHCTEMCVCFSS